MKIIIVCYPTFGGSGVLATELGHQLSENGHSVHFIAYEKPVRLKVNDESIFFHKVNVPFYPLFNFQPYELALSTKIVDVATKNSIDLIHVHYAIPHAYAAYMAQKMLKMNNIKLPIITTLHGTDITLVGKHPFYKNAVKFSIEKSNIVTSVSESLKNDTHEFFETKKKIEIIPNFVDIRKFDIQLNLCNQSDIIKTITHVSIHFLGNTNEVEKELCHSDIFVLPSKAESFGLAALEAMASKNAIVSSNVGGLPELNLNNKTGFTCEYSDINHFVLSIEKLLKDDNLLESFKTKAYNEAKKYDINDVVPLYEKEYKKLLS